MPPIIGPTMNPIPTAAPIRPIARARTSGADVSARYAWATLMVAPEPPSRTRENRSSHRLPDRAKSAYDAALPASPSSSTGRRPTLSLTRPQNGASANWIAEYDPTRAPTITGPAPSAVA
jgi:hypothetical protein